MKRIVFLFTLIAVFTSSITISNADKEFVENGSTYYIKEFMEEGSRGFILEKKGMNPFSTSLLIKGESFIINGISEIENYIYLYGSAHVSGAETFYDAVIFKFDEEGNYVHKITLDYGILEEGIDVIYIDNILLYMVEQHYTDDGMYYFNSNYFVQMDLDLTVLGFLETSQEVKEKTVKDNILLLDYEYDGVFEVGIRSNLDTLTASDILPIENGQIFRAFLDIEFLNNAFLNGEEVFNGIYVDYPGYYVLEYNGNIYEFTIDPVIIGVENKGIYMDEVTIQYDKGNAFLNGEVYYSNDVIDKPGNYEFSLKGINGYEKTLVFTIVSNVAGLRNEAVYNQPFEFTFNGDGYLNEQYVESPVYVTDSGEYTFKVLGEQDYMETFEFELKEAEEKSVIDFVQRYDIVILISAIITGIIILKKK